MAIATVNGNQNSFLISTLRAVKIHSTQFHGRISSKIAHKMSAADCILDGCFDPQATLCPHGGRDHVQKLVKKNKADAHLPVAFLTFHSFPDNSKTEEILHLVLIVPRAGSRFTSECNRAWEIRYR